MARDYLNIGSVPADEDCQQTGMPSYNATMARAECRAFLNQLIRQFGREPGSARLAIKSFPHDFGTYSEVVCYFDDSDSEGMDYAFKLEGEMPEKWDSEAMAELKAVAAAHAGSASASAGSA
jgi:hypothetical protein